MFSESVLVSLEGQCSRQQLSARKEPTALRRWKPWPLQSRPVFLCGRPWPAGRQAWQFFISKVYLLTFLGNVLHLRAGLWHEEDIFFRTTKPMLWGLPSSISALWQTRPMCELALLCPLRGIREWVVPSLNFCSGSVLLTFALPSPSPKSLGSAVWRLGSAHCITPQSSVARPCVK